ncbi:unnamed protein product [Rhodiola kirilowii]
MMIRAWRVRRRCISIHRRKFSSSSSSDSSNCVNNLKSNQLIPPHSAPVLHRPYNLIDASRSSTIRVSKRSLAVVSATLASACAAAYVVRSGEEVERLGKGSIYGEFERTMEQYNSSFLRIVNQMKQTGAAAAVLWQSLRSVMSSANHEVRVGFELRVASLLADISAANGSRRAAIVGAGGGKVLDWLLDRVAVVGDNVGTQAEVARALAYLVADQNVCESVLGRPRAVPSLLRFIFTCQPQKSKHPKRSSFDVIDSLKGRSMLVTAIMDIVTSSCDSADKMSFKPSLSANAEMRDIAAAIQVIEEGSMHLEELGGNEDDDDGGNGIKGIGMKVLGGTTILGLSRTSEVMKLTQSHDGYPGSTEENLRNLVYHNKQNGSIGQANFSSSVVPGLWDDLHCQHVAVPFAAWALANWAVSSDVNRHHIQELDRDGQAVMSALVAPERSVKWHGCLMARSLLGDYNLPLNDSVSDWSSSLLSTIFHASKNEDISLAKVALSAFLLSIERSDRAQKVVMEKGLQMMREATKKTRKHKDVQESFAKVMEWLCTGEMHLSLEEGQRWSAILLPWIFGHMSSDSIRDSATKILSRFLEDYGPYSVPISQGWLAMILNEVLTSDKRLKGTAQVKSDKVQTQIDQSNLVSAGQIANQLVGAVVNLAANQVQITLDSDDAFPLKDLLSLEPFAVQFKNLKKDSLPKLDAADSAIATLKGVKSLAEVCADDSSCQNKLLDWGILCLLRRLLLQDDYEKLAAIETYDASRVHEARDRGFNAPGEVSAVDPNGSSSVRVPPTAHIRRHAARLLTILSVLPNAQKVIEADKTLCKWLDDCANGKIPGCNDLKLQSYARATLLNIFCCHQLDKTSESNCDSESGSGRNTNCPRYGDMIFLINPEMPHWKCLGKPDMTTDTEVAADEKQQHIESGSLDMPPDRSSKYSELEDPMLDVIFVHGLRGGPYKTWRIAEDKSSTKSGLVEKIDEEAGVQGTFWPGEWLPSDLNQARLFTLKYKTNLTQWSGASLPLQEVSSMLLEKLIDAGIGDRPVVFVTHSMGGLVVKQLLYKARERKLDSLVNNTVGVVFYSCPHFGSKLADMPWRMGYVLRPAPSIGELRSGSERLVELNDFFRQLHKRGQLHVLSFCETKVTPIVEGYGGWAFRMEIVPIESAYPGFGELIVLESTDHINSCKPLSRSDPSYTETLNFLNKLKAQLSSDPSCH